MRILHQSSTFVYIVLGLFLLFVILMAFVLYSQAFGKSYSLQLGVPDVPRVVEISRQTFSIRRILVEEEGGCQSIEILRNGQASKIDCEDRLDNRLFISNDRLQSIFGNLTQEKFEQLESKYYLVGLEKDIILTLETNHGTKVIVISGNDDTATPIDEDIVDIIDIIDDIQEELDNPPASPPPTPNPTPTPSGSTGPSPTASPTPSPTPTPDGYTPDPVEPFDCGMLSQTGVTVSNIRCLDE